MYASEDLTDTDDSSSTSSQGETDNSTLDKLNCQLGADNNDGLCLNDLNVNRGRVNRSFSSDSTLDGSLDGEQGRLLSKRGQPNQLSAELTSRITFGDGNTKTNNNSKSQHNQFLRSSFNTASKEDRRRSSLKLESGDREPLLNPPATNRNRSFNSSMFEKVRLVNKMKIRMRRRKFSTRFFQVCVVTVVITLFLYFLFQANIQSLKVSNLKDLTVSFSFTHKFLYTSSCLTTLKQNSPRFSQYLAICSSA